MNKALIIIVTLFVFTGGLDAQIEENSSKIHSQVDVMPEYPGGNAELGRFIQNNIMYPDLAMETNTQGKVYVKFVVKKDGEIAQVQVLRGIGAGCDAEAVRVIKRFPKWKPGIHDGKPVNVWYTLPINYTLPKDEVVEVVMSYHEVDVKPEFVGGYNALKDLIHENIVYPKMALKTKTSGKVNVVFTIKSDGSVKDVLIERGIGAGCDAEAVRVIKESPNWKPGEFEGKAVSTKFRLSITYKINEDGKSGIGVLSALDIKDKKLVVDNVIPERPQITEDNTPLLLVAEVKPEFPGGIPALGKYLKDNMQYPEKAIKNGTEGNVYLKFIVKEDGSLHNLTVLRGIGDGCDEEAIRLIESSPNWKPGEQMGKPINIWYTLPIRFRLSKGDEE